MSPITLGVKPPTFLPGTGQDLPAIISAYQVLTILTNWFFKQKHISIIMVYPLHILR